MNQFHLEIRIKPRPGLLNPEGKAIHHALESLGWEGVSDARVGKVVYLDLSAASSEDAVDAATAMCRTFLANPVTEDFEVSVAGESAGV